MLNMHDGHASYVCVVPSYLSITSFSCHGRQTCDVFSQETYTNTVFFLDIVLLGCERGDDEPRKQQPAPRRAGSSS